MNCTKTVALANRVVPLDAAAAMTVGVLLQRARSTQIVDGTVTALALRWRPSLVLTSDPDDIAKLANAAGATCRVGRRGPRRADVVVEPI
jgi:coenzyme F420-reducing hydrogenase beta subunit